MNRRYYIWAFFISAIAASLFGSLGFEAAAQGQEGPSPCKTYPYLSHADLSSVPEDIVVVNGEPIKRDEIVRRLWFWTGRGLADNMVDWTLAEQEAKRVGVTFTEDEVDKKVSEIQVWPGKTIEQMADLSGISMGLVRYGAAMSLMTDRVAEKLAVVNEADLDRVRVRHIMVRVPYGETPEETQGNDERARATAEEAYKKLTAGDTYEHLAELYSDDVSNRTLGGEISWINRGSLIPEIEEKIFAAKEGEIIKPFRTPYGYEVMQVENREIVSEMDPKKRDETISAGRKRAQSDTLDRLPARLRNAAKIVHNYEFPQHTEGTYKDVPEVVMTLNGQDITKHDVMDRLWNWTGKGMAKNSIRWLLLDQAARAAGVTVTPEEVTERVEKATLPPDTTLEQMLELQGMTMEMFEWETRDGLLTEKLAALQVSIDPKNLDQVRVSQILIRKEVSGEGDGGEGKRTPEESKKLADDIYARLRAGERFEDLAKQFSEDLPSKPRGGDIGYVKRGKMQPKLEEVIFSLKKGQISEPVESQFAYHIFLATDRKMFDELPPSEKASVMEEEKRTQIGEIAPKMVQDLQDKAKIEWNYEFPPC
jgi:parvulin-like peptidyl-prolyl isomerase